VDERHSSKLSQQTVCQVDGSETEDEGLQIATCKARPRDSEGTFMLGPAEEGEDERRYR
jgi:hypothetical protein